MFTKVSCVIMVLVAVVVQSLPVLVPTSASLSDEVQSTTIATRTMSVAPTKTTTVKHTTQTNENIRLPRSEYTTNANNFMVRTLTPRFDTTEYGDASLSSMFGNTKGLLHTTLKTFTKTAMDRIGVTSPESGRTSLEKTRSQRTPSALMTTREDHAEKTPSFSNYVPSTLVISTTESTEQPDTSIADTENTEHRTTAKAELEQTSEHNIEQGGQWVQDKQNGGRAKKRNDVTHQASGSNPSVTILSSSQNGNVLQSVSRAAIKTPESRRIPNLNKLLEAAYNVKRILENLEIFAVKNLRKMCAMDKMPLRFSTGCVKVSRSLPSLTDNMSTVRPEQTIYAELQAGYSVFKTYGELLNTAQIRLCSVFVDHRCPVTCDVMADYSSFSHLETKVCTLQAAKLLLNGAVNVMNGVVNSAPASTQNLGADDSVWDLAVPELLILTGLTHEVKHFINILRESIANN